MSPIRPYPPGVNPLSRPQPALHCFRYHLAMISVPLRRSILSGMLLAFASAIATVSFAQTDISAQYLWQPVRIGGGGWVVGMVIHPLDPTVRYARTDVGSPYRWESTGQQWIPMRVLSADGSGIQSPSETSAPSGYGVDSIAVDPTNTNVVYLVFPTQHSTDVVSPTNFVEIYKSVDGGKNFTPGNMQAASILGNPNGSNRMDGEKLIVDPANPSVLYYGSDSQGLYRSLDDGATWAQMPISGSSGAPANFEFISTQFARASGTVTINGVVLSKTVYAASINNGGDAGGDVFQTQDGGQTWTDISTGVTDTPSGQSLTHQALSSSIDAADNLYVIENNATNQYRRAYWKYSAAKWTRVSLEGFANQPLTGVAVDPTNAQRIYALCTDTSLSRSDDGGVTWINLGAPQYANTLGWLPQTVGMAGGQWHSNGGIKIDSAGNLWSPTGQEGTINIPAATASSATAANPPMWTITSKGIEELVSMDLVVPPGSNDTIVATAEDTTGFYIPNPDNFSAVQIPLQQEIISQGTSVAYAPDAPGYVAITTSNVYTNGKNYSGYSTNGGLTWTPFGPALQHACGTSMCDIPAGLVAVSARGTRTLGSDHIVLYPPASLAPEYSQDGGATWHVTQSFPLASDGVTISSSNYTSFPYAEVNQHTLRSDPFTPDKFYLKFIHAPSLLYISTDGGKTWLPQNNTNLPDQAWTGQLVVNGKLQNDLWYADGYQGSTPHGVFHSTDGGQTFQQIPGITHAIVIAVGAGSGNAGDAPYAVYFYGQFAAGSPYGIFRSTDAGATWDRISYYPTGLYNTPSILGASQDTFGKVYIGFSGNSFAYGQIVSSGGGGPALPGAPTGLTATVASANKINLAWTAASGTVTSYSIFRGTAQGGESTTPIATAVTSTAYADSSLTAATKYWYQVAAVNATGQGTASNEASATTASPTISLAAAAGASTSATVTAGQTATYQLSLTTSSYTGTLTFTCTGAPAGDTCTQPSPLNVTPATTTTPISVSVQTAAASSSVREERNRGEMALAALFLAPFLFRRKKRSVLLVALLAASSMMMAASGCGSSTTGGGTTPPPPVTSTLTLTASGSGVTSASQTLTLTVNQ